ncbi:hypothetical protein CEUSTIGMA_g4100.t1 [Chlamydomonas eustigma]|uniref:Ketoreductase (KR) domain-containing protein n=1 Tax=Chlamydomonas eustigma TaxID=1157962 RepID=A0A250X0M7_9CHLO|nr:hypothetical protein CEUSTIGMA_g4100.t1 [Chlamydomonas eustigma]|eukprot:GAX76654.1 hypothetical protein CEUSTIGMA_g4100.t1 [Chlamydomonas eustigma]
MEVMLGVPSEDNNPTGGTASSISADPNTVATLNQVEQPVTFPDADGGNLNKVAASAEAADASGQPAGADEDAAGQQDHDTRSGRKRFGSFFARAAGGAARRFAAVGVGAVTGASYAGAAAVSVVQTVGFTTAGIAAKSAAASMMAAEAVASGGTIAAGGVVSTLQSIGATGTLAAAPACVTVAVPLVGAGVGAAMGYRAWRAGKAVTHALFRRRSDKQLQVYVVFGATGGIGSSLSKRLAKQDQASVVLVGRDQGKLDALQSELSPSAATTTLLADVTDSKQVEEAIFKAEKMYGHISGVVNCVGSIALKSEHTTSDIEFNQVIQLNLTSCFNILRSSVKHMMKSGGGPLCSAHLQWQEMASRTMRRA